MTRTLSRPPTVATSHDGPAVEAGLGYAFSTVLDLAVVVLATWTVVYHGCLLLRLGVAWAVGLEVVAAAGWGLVWWWARRRSRDSPPAPGDSPPVSVQSGSTVNAVATDSSTAEPVLAALTAGSGVAAAVLVAVDGPWPAVAVLWLAAAAAGTAWAVSRQGRAPVVDPLGEPVAAARQPIAGDTATGHPTDTVIALAWATALGVLSTFTRWPNPDDLYYVNLSQWVVDHGTFPLRDTIFSDLVFPMSSWPPMASYDAGVGTLARLAGVHAASVAYVCVPPVATFLSVLAMWRLLTAWRIRPVWVALSIALLFLLFDGGSGYAAPGNLFLIRIWQGKVILLCLMMPTLLVYALRYVELPTRRRAGWLFAGGVAAVGLSTSAMFLVPLVAVGGAAPLLLRRPGKALQGFLAMAAYPLAAGVVTVAVGGRSADLFGSRELFRFDPAWFGDQILRDGPVAVIAVTAVLCGALLVPHRAARVTTGVLTLITGVTFVPGFTRLSYDLVGLGPTLWRVSWVASIAALVGVLGARIATYRPRRAVRVAGPLGLVVALAVFGVPLVSERTGVDLAAPPHWQRGPESVVSSQLAIAAASPGDVILASEELSITIDVSTTRVKTVAPRDYFMDYLRGDPSFHYSDRLTLVNFANQVIGRADLPAVAHGLAALHVDEVCLPSRSRQRIGFVRGQGYRLAASSPTDRCLTR